MTQFEVPITDLRRSFFDSLAPRWETNLTDDDCKYIQRIIQQALPHSFSPKPVLDVGCGTGVLFQFLEHYQVVALDYSLQMLRYAKLRGAKNVLTYVCADAHRLPFLDDSFSSVLMFNVFPHFYAPERALAEAARVLEPHGTLAIFHLLDPPSLSSLHNSIGEPVANDTLPDEHIMESFLARAGFTIFYRETTQRFALVCRKS